MSDAEQLQVLAEQVRGSGILGRSPLIRRLFDFLIECSTSGRAPKEAEVAIEVFGKDPSFDGAQDAMVRVYVHKLRRKLEEYYAAAGRAEQFRLCIPKGAYRFVVAEPALAPQCVQQPAQHSVQYSAQQPLAGHFALQAAAGQTVPAPTGAEPLQPSRRRGWLSAALAASVLINIALLGLFYGSGIARHPLDEVARASRNPLWSRVLQDDRPILLVLGDYYIFGEIDSNMEVTRLVREFSINSAEDLDQYLKLHPQMADKYMDMQLQYLPTSAAYALRDLMPLLAPAQRRVRIVLASQLNPDMLKSADIIYMGYLSGMGMLSDLVFAGSRFAVGDSFDELVDRTTGTHYISQAAMPMPDEEKYHDYGYFATFAGPTGNQIVVIAGTRDVAVMHTAESVTRPAPLGQLTASEGPGRSFEALYDVFGMDGTNLDGKLLLTGKLDTSRIWTEDSPRPATVPAATATAAAAAATGAAAAATGAAASAAATAATTAAATTAATAATATMRPVGVHGSGSALRSSARVP